MSSAIKPYIDLCRVSNLPTVWSNVLAALLLGGSPFSFALFLPIALSMSLFYCAGMCLNDYFDEAWDRREKPFRPIPSGRVSPINAAVLTALLFAAGFVLLLAVPHKRSLVAALNLVFAIVLYDKIHKQYPLSVLLMAFCRLMVFVVTGIAVSGTLTGYVIAGGLVQFFYTLAVSVVARHENQRGRPFSRPVIPLMIAGMSLLDGLMMSIFVAPLWLFAGVAAAAATRYGQRFVRGD